MEKPNLKTSKPRIILGAGLAGLSAAFFLQKGYQIFEQEPQIGGLCRSRCIDGYTFDYDGHLLHFRNKFSKNLVRQLLGDNLRCLRRNSGVSLLGCELSYPFQAHLFGLPAKVIQECISGFIQAQLKKDRKLKPKANFQDWALDSFGPGMAKYFILPYNRKFWNIPLQNLTPQWVNDYIPVPAINDVLRGAVAQSKKLIGYNARFWYPRRGGIDGLISAFKDQLSCDIEMRHQAVEIDLAKKSVRFSNGRGVKFNQLISTIPLPEMLQL
ncbi:MAG: NAD(P)-binding protein, partial [Candidatus Omnitrophica bacterium]|nr:NAD(P)-binding protein [Candidatus Omnitrophota bacterium]